MTQPSLYDPDVYRGQTLYDVPLGAQSWFRAGGNADVVFSPEDLDDLSVFLKEFPRSEPLMVLGGMANCIIRDGGIRGCVVRLGKPFAEIEIMENRVMAGAGALNGSVAAAAAKAGIGGLEFLSGIPGTVGGALRMNAGAYGTEIKDIFVGAGALDFDGNLVHLTPQDMQYSYRHCGAPTNLIFAGAVFAGVQEDGDIVRARLKEIKSKRQVTQPIAESTGGSTFANPSAAELAKAGLPEGMRAWELVERVGGRGLKVGGAMMSEKHCNFMINAGGASGADLENLGDELIRRVREETGISLRWEIKRLGMKI